MVRDFQHLGSQVFSGLNQLILSFSLDIPRKEESMVLIGDLQDDGAVIGLGPWILSAHHPVSEWVEYLHLHPIDPSRR